MKKVKKSNFGTTAMAIAAALEPIFYAFVVLVDAAVGVHCGQSGRRTRSNWVHHGSWGSVTRVIYDNIAISCYQLSIAIITSLALNQLRTPCRVALIVRRVAFDDR